MISPDVICNAAGVIGNVISVGLWLLPVPRFWKIIKTKSVGRYRPDPYLATLLNCMIWVFYVLPFVRPNSMLVLTVNGIGLLIEAIYVGVFLVLAPGKERLRMLAVLGGEAVFMAVLVVGVLLGVQTHELRSVIVGNLCVILNTMMYASSLTIMCRVVETKNNVEYVPFSLLLMGFLNGACWTAYALIKSDHNIAILHDLGMLLSLAQIVLYLCYCKSTPKEVKKVEVPTVCHEPSNAINGSNILIDVKHQAQQHAQHYKRD